MERGKQVANNATERWKTKENRKRVVEKVTENLIKHGALKKESSLSELVHLVERFEEKVNASANTEAEYISLMTAEANKAKYLFTNTSASETAANIDWQGHIYERLQFLKKRYYSVVQAFYQRCCKELKADPSTQVLNSRESAECRYHKGEMEYVFSLFELSKSQITPNIMFRVIKAEDYVQTLLKISKQPNKQQSPDVQSKQQSIGPSNSRFFESTDMFFEDHQVAMPICSSQRGINQPSVAKGPDNAVQQQTNIALKGFGESINTPRISATEEAFGTSTNTQRISPLIKESNNQNQVSQESTLGSEELSPAMQQLIKAMTSISHEALSAEVGDIEEVVRLNDEIPEAKLLNERPDKVDELGLPTFTISKGWKMPRNFVATAFDTPNICAGMRDGLNQFTDAAATDLNSFTMKGKCLQIVENQNLLAEIKDINNRLFDCEVVIAEKENVESADGVAAEQRKGILVKIMYNAVTINQDLVSHFTSDKKSLIKPLRLLIPGSYPSSSLVILDELPLKVSDDLRALFERAKAKLRFKLLSMNKPWLVKDIARVWERCAREAILDYAHVNGGGTFTSMYGGWEVCR